MKTRILGALAVAGLVAGLAGCSSGDAGAPASGGAGESKTVGLLYQLKAAEISVRGGENLQDAADVLGWSMVETDPAGDPAKANTGLANFAIQKPDMVLSASWEPAVITQGLDKVAAADVPVMNIWGGIASLDGIDGQIAPDESNFGKVAAEELASRLEPGSKVIALNSNAFTFGQLRWDEFTKIMAAKNIEIVAEHQTDYTNPQADTTKAINDMLNANPDIDGIWTDSSLQVPGVAQVLSERGMCDGSLAVVGFYGDLQNLQAIRDNCYSAIADIPVQPQGWVVMDTIADHLYNGTDLPTTAPAGYPIDVLAPQVITKDNVPTDATAYFNVDWDYKTYFTDRWAKGEYGPEN